MSVIDLTLDQSESDFGSRIRFSRLKLIGESPAHYQAGADTSDTSARDKGTAVHSILLKDKSVTFYPEKTADGKSAPRRGEKWERFKADNPGRQILSASEYECTMRMVQSVRACRPAMEVLKGKAEETILFDLLGMECRTTPDVNGGSFFTELKTSKSSKPSRFASQSFYMNYHAQMAFHRIGIRRAKKGTADTGYVMAVASTHPYLTTVMKMTERALEKGDRIIRAWMELLKTCEASNQWPGYSQSIIDLDVPEDEELQFPGGVAEEAFTAENLPPGW
jgi:hypothetical protein